MVRSVIFALVAIASAQDHLQTKVDQEHGCQGASNCCKKPTCCAGCTSGQALNSVSSLALSATFATKVNLVALVAICVGEMIFAVVASRLRSLTSTALRSCDVGKLWACPSFQANIVEVFALGQLANVC